jgi:hypothetical protein
MKTVIKNSAHDPCLPVSLTPCLSEVDQPKRRLSSCFNSFPAIRLSASVSDQIRVTFSTSCPPGALRKTVKKSEITNPQKPLKFHFITLSITFFSMPKVKPGKETVKFLAIFDHASIRASPSFSLLPSVKSPVLTL